jgi:membrane protease YdiL (CAAX protease family)
MDRPAVPPPPAVAVPPRPDRPWPFATWGLRELLTVGLAPFGIALLSEFLLIGFLGLRGQGAGLALVLIQQVALGGVVIVWVRSVDGTLAPLGLAPGWSGRDVGTGVAAGFGAAFAGGTVIIVTVAVVEAIVGHSVEVSTPLEPYRGAFKVVVSLIAVVVAPVCEEVLFRGFLFQGLRRRFAFWPSALLSGAFFAFVHAEPIRFFGLMTMGVILAGVFERRKTLVAPIAAHATVNLLATLASLGR